MCFLFTGKHENMAATFKGNSSGYFLAGYQTSTLSLVTFYMQGGK